MIGIGIANAIGFNRNNKGSIRIPTAIKNSMVLWYDIAKQKATNESMAENPTLKDLSGNGNDATCYNFGWSRMSGIGGYVYDFTQMYISSNRITATKTNNIFSITSILDTNIQIYKQSGASEAASTIPSYKIKVSGLTDNQTILYLSSSQTFCTIMQDGEYTLPSFEFEGNGKVYGFRFNTIQEKCNIVIEQLPLYPNALVSDGVDDYALVQDKYDDEGNLINKKSLVLNREDGYTVIAKRKWINEPTAGTFNPIASKASSITVAEPNAFIFEWNRIANSARNYGCWNFGYANTLSNITDEDVVYQTSKSYNGQKSLTIGSNEDSDRLYIASLIDNTGFANIALYSLLLFNRDLTDEEIQWVKNNLMQ